MFRIQEIRGREILSSGSTPTIEAEVLLDNGIKGEASVPYGASAGSHEAHLLFDGDAKRYFGNGMLKSVSYVNTEITKALLGMDAQEQRKIDETLIALDGTSNKSRLGANAILAVSLATARAVAEAEKKPFYQYIRDVFELPIKDYVLPNPMMVVIEGGKHADRSTDVQEYIVSTYGSNSAKENIRMGIEIYQTLKKVLKKEGYGVNVGNEGAFAPEGISDNELPLRFVMEAIQQAGYVPLEHAGISIDAAASEFFRDSAYTLSIEKKVLSPDDLIAYYMSWLSKYPIVTTEDMFHEDDWDAWTAFTMRSSVPNIGDDLTVTNIQRLEEAIAKKAINAILIKLNQIGTLTETVDCCMLARRHGFMTVCSHRGGGESNDTAMVDLAVAVNSGFIKVGPSRGERVCKYNRLMRIEEELGENCSIAGRNFRKVQ